MHTYIPTKQELSQVVQEAVKELLQEELPKILRQAKRKPWLTTDDLIKLTGWSKRTCQRLRDKRKIPFTKDGRKILYPTDGIEKYLKKRRIQPLDVEEL